MKENRTYYFSAVCKMGDLRSQCTLFWSTQGMSPDKRAVKSQEEQLPLDIIVYPSLKHWPVEPKNMLSKLSSLG